MVPVLGEEWRLYTIRVLVETGDRSALYDYVFRYNHDNTSRGSATGSGVPGISI